MSGSQILILSTKCVGGRSVLTCNCVFIGGWLCACMRAPRVSVLLITDWSITWVRWLRVYDATDHSLCCSNRLVLVILVINCLFVSLFLSFFLLHWFTGWHTVCCYSHFSLSVCLSVALFVCCSVCLHCCLIWVVDMFVCCVFSTPFHCALRARLMLLFY